MGKLDKASLSVVAQCRQSAPLAFQSKYKPSLKPYTQLFIADGKENWTLRWVGFCQNSMLVCVIGTAITTFSMFTILQMRDLCCDIDF